MKTRLIAALLVCANSLQAHAESLFKIPENAAQELPAGVPRTVDTNGRVISIDGMFTTEAYQNEALRLVIQEANKVAKEMNLPEALPISESVLTRAYIGPFGFSYQLGAVGNITTSNYWYFVKRGQKFSDLTIADYDDYYVKYQDEKHQVPLRELNPKAAYHLATQWLAAVHIDVQGLNRDCKLHIDLTTDMLPGFAESKEKKTRSKITPLYFVSWRAKNKTKDSDGSVAYVELYLPKKQLLQLSVEDPKYILRPPVVFTNLASLFPGKATITTNKPGKIIVIDGSKWPTDNTYAVPENVK